ncbi:hypothetical protein RN001_003059 [Aquatica leii]|uniref:Mutator-like transposase domain-containing protein n=1 Tax=Aquatica leii TaxID=1421715 RepID=A0AAN7QNV6_9COLE|nr:hypothetical protein RN001_003059 [Aquatica leii]
MEKATKEEANIAKRRGDVDENGVPFITVVANGSWAKRSYRKNYNSSSGVGCIIAAAYRSSENLDLAKKIELLSKDIQNVPNHILGSHINCDR